MACEVVACRACLSVDKRLVSLQGASLGYCYRTLTGEQPYALDGLPQHLCFECAARARRSSAFLEQCMRARDLLFDLLNIRCPIKAEDLRLVDRDGAVLLSQLRCCPQPPAMHYRHAQLTAGTAPSHQDYDIYINKYECTIDETYIPSPGTSIKDDFEFQSDCNDVKDTLEEVQGDLNEVHSDLEEVQGDSEEVLSDCNGMKSGEPVAEHLKLDHPHEENVKIKMEIFKSEKRMIREDPLKKERDREIIGEVQSDPEEAKSDCDIVTVDKPLAKQLKLNHTLEKKEKTKVKISKVKNRMNSKDPLKKERDREIMGEVLGEPEEAQIDCDIVTVDGPLAKQLKLDHTLEKKVKTKVKISKSEKRMIRKDPVKREGDGEINVVSLKKKAAGSKKFNCCDFAIEINLTHEEQLEEHRKRQTSSNYINSPCKCDKCYKGFLDEITYGNHMQRHQPSSGAHVCDVCAMRFRTTRKMRQHVVQTHSRKYKCRACHQVSNTSTQARQHERWHKGFTYQCKLCDKSFRKRSTHLSHIRLCHPTEFVCDVCGESFGGRYGLEFHKRRHKEPPEGGESQAVYCSECDIHFSTQEAMKRHAILAKHIRNTDFKCLVCGETFESKSSMTLHGWSHARRVGAVKCKQCEATFTSTRKCHEHLKRIHLGRADKQSFVCEYCGKKCSTKWGLVHHQRRHTCEKPFPCSECPKHFGSRLQQQQHECTHTDERPYRCDLCHKTFKYKCSYKNHLRIHSGSRKIYTCNICGKVFSDRSNMTRHRKMHSGREPVECEVCKKEFKSADTLQTHVKYVHLKQPYPPRRRRAPPAAAQPPAQPNSDSEAT